MWWRVVLLSTRSRLARGVRGGMGGWFSGLRDAMRRRDGLVGAYGDGGDGGVGLRSPIWRCSGLI